MPPNAGMTELCLPVSEASDSNLGSGTLLMPRESLLHWQPLLIYVSLFYSNTTIHFKRGTLKDKASHLRATTPNMFVAEMSPDANRMVQSSVSWPERDCPGVRSITKFKFVFHFTNGDAKIFAVVEMQGTKFFPVVNYSNMCYLSSCFLLPGMIPLWKAGTPKIYVPSVSSF